MTTGEEGFGPDGEPTADRWESARHLFDSVDSAQSPVVRYNRAELLFNAKDYVKAANLLTGIVEEFPEQVAPRLLLARAYYHSAQLRRAEEQLREIIERDPVEFYAQLMLGRTLQRQGRHEEAARWLHLASPLSRPSDEDDSR